MLTPLSCLSNSTLSIAIAFLKGTAFVQMLESFELVFRMKRLACYFQNVLTLVHFKSLVNWVSLKWCLTLRLLCWFVTTRVFMHTTLIRVPDETVINQFFLDGNILLINLPLGHVLKSETTKLLTWAVVVIHRLLSLDWAQSYSLINQLVSYWPVKWVLIGYFVLSCGILLWFEGLSGHNLFQFRTDNPLVSCICAVFLVVASVLVRVAYRECGNIGIDLRIHWQNALRNSAIMWDFSVLTNASCCSRSYSCLNFALDKAPPILIMAGNCPAFFRLNHLIILLYSHLLHIIHLNFIESLLHDRLGNHLRSCKWSP